MSDKSMAIVFFLVVAVVLALAIWTRTSASCDSIDWLPAGNIPGRCFR